MRMKGQSKRTPLLVAAAVVLVAANVWWFTRGGAHDEADFVLGANTEGVILDPASLEQLPAYEPQRDVWTVQGKTLASLDGYIRQENGPASLPYLLAALSPQASTQDFRAMLMSLTDRGICNFALVQMEAQQKEVMATVQHIVSVRDASGVLKPCKASPRT